MTLYPNNVASKLVLQITSIVSGIAFLALFGKPILEGVLKVVVESFFSKQEFQTELITEIHNEDRLNSPEQFEEKFMEILGKVDKKLVIVFDNIDRVQGDVAISILSTIKTFMYSGGENKIVFVVPCDPTAIEVQVRKYFHGEKFDMPDNVQDSFEASEYLRKIFNLILWIPEFINSDLEEYTRQLIKESGGDISKLLDDDDVVLVINAAFSNNPREIIQFINNLVALIITIEGTGVKDIIFEHIAYLAKVLVLRQKFPDAYQRLKVEWINPEKIYSVGKPEDVRTPLHKFMQDTSRITVENAEPFIYYKDTADTRGVKNPTKLSTALVSASTDDAIELSKTDDHAKLLLFIADHVKRYATQENVLLNVVLTQFAVTAAHNVDKNSKKYINDLVHYIDTSLWGRYTELPVPEIFDLLKAQHLDKKSRVMIIDRYMAALEADEGITPIKHQIIDAIRNNPTLLSNAQKTKFRSVLEGRYASDEPTLALFNNTEDQEQFISKGLIENYIANIDFTNVETRLQTVSNYKEYILKIDAVSKIVDKFSKLLEGESTKDTAFNDNKETLVGSVGTLVGIFSAEIKDFPENLSNLVAELNKAYSGASRWEEKAKIANSLFWLEGNLSDGDNNIVVDTIRNYFQSWGNLQNLQEIFNNWGDETAQDLIRIALPVLLNKLTNDAEVLHYVYAKSGDEEKSTIINHLISSSPVDNPYDINFIGQLESLPDRSSTIASLLEKAGRTSWDRRAPYYVYIAKIVRSNDTGIKATAIEQAKELITSSNSQQAEVGLNFLNGLKLNKSERRKVSVEVLTWLRDPGRNITGEQRVAFDTVASSYEPLQDTAKNDFIFFLFSLLDQNKDIQTTQVLIASLLTVKPKYKDFSKDFDDLLTRLQTWPDSPTKQHIYQKLPSLNVGGRSKAEKQYWESFDALYTEEES